jgi:hypothetical protein
MKHAVKKALKPGFMALGLAMMLSALCHGQTQWSGENNLGGDPNSIPFAIQVPGTNVLQIFYQGTDNALWTRWRNTDGTWSSEQSLGGQLYSGSYSEGNLYAAPVAAQIPGNILQVFYRGADNQLWTLWRNPPNGNNPPAWSSPQPMGGILAGDPAVAVIPGTSTIQVFYQGADHGMYTRWLTNGTWSKEVGMGGSLFTQTCDDATNPSCFGNSAIPVPIQIPGTNDLEVFYRGSDGQLHGFLRSSSTGSWSTSPQDFGGNMASDPSAAPINGSNLIQVFYQGGDTSPADPGGCTHVIGDGTCQAGGGGLMTQWGNESSWTHETQMAGHLEGYFCTDWEPEYEFCAGDWNANYGVPKAYTQPGTNNMFVIYPGADGGKFAAAPTLWGQERTPDGTWHSEFNLGTYATANAGPSDVSYGVIPGTDTVQIFYTGFEFSNLSGVTYNVLTQWTQ